MTRAIMKYFLPVIFIFISVDKSLAQKTDLTDCLNSLIEIIEKDYAGFSLKTDAYQIDHKKIKETISKELEDCRKDKNSSCDIILYKYLSNFKDGHILLAKKINSGEASSFLNGKLKYTNNLFTLKSNVEGLWYSENHDYIFKITKIGFGYVGKIVMTTSKRYKQGQIKFYIYPTSENRGIASNIARYYTGDTINYFTSTYFKNDSTLVFSNFMTLKSLPLQINPQIIIDNPPLELSYNPSFYTINNTNIFKIPSFSSAFNNAIDSICKANNQLILSKENLILDFRGNSGGMITGSYPLVKYLYTQPFKYVEGYMMASDSAYSFYSNYSSGLPDDDTTKKIYSDLVKQIKNNKNKLIRDSAEWIKHDTIYKSPKNVGIIIDSKCKSATELIILAFVSSRKVILLGESTGGVVDTGEALDYNLICNTQHFFLSVPSVVCDYGRKNSLDEKGVSPHYKINTNSTNCIAEAITILNKIN